MKGSTRLDVVSSGGLGMEKAILKSLRDRFEENTNSIVRKLGEGWEYTPSGASCGHRENDVGVIASVYSKDRESFAYRIKVETVNVGSGKNFDTPNACKTPLIEKLKDISHICNELVNKLDNSHLNSDENESDSQESTQPKSPDDSVVGQ